MEVNESSNVLSCTMSNEDMAMTEKCCSNAKCVVSDPGSSRCMSIQAMQSLYDLRQNNLLCDAVLRLEDGGVFPIHRAILSTCSNYFRFVFTLSIEMRPFQPRNFRTLFTTTLHSKEKTDFLLPSVTSKIMNLLLEYAYLRNLDVRQDNVCKLLITADYLNIYGVVQLCSDYLKKNLSPENCIGIMLFAREHFFKGLEKEARRYILLNFEQVKRGKLQRALFKPIR